MTINVHQAKTHFSKLLLRVEAGEEVTIAKSGVPVARLVPIASARKARTLGQGRGTVKIAANFDAPLPAVMLNTFEGGGRSRRKVR